MRINRKFSVIILLEKSKVEILVGVPSTVLITINGIRREISLGLKVKPTYWNQLIENVEISTHPNPKLAARLYERVANTLDGVISWYKIFIVLHRHWRGDFHSFKCL